MEQDYNVWFGKRLKEVMDHFGMTAKSLGEQSGVGRMTISRIVQGRYATAEEVKKIAETLGITVERLKQKDVELVPEKWTIPRRIEDLDGALQEAYDLRVVALGDTEMALAYQMLGTIHCMTNQMIAAIDAFRIGFTILKYSEDEKLRYLAYVNLMYALQMNQDFESLRELCNEAEQLYRDQPDRILRVLQFKASVLIDHDKNYEEALAIFQKRADFLEHTVMYQNYRRTLCNMAELCFRMYNYEQSKTYYELALLGYPDAESFRIVELHQYKDYIITLICLGEFEKARAVLDRFFDEAMAFEVPVNELPEVRSHYLLLAELLNGDGTAAKELLAMQKENNDQLNFLATMLLCFAHYKKGEKREMLDVFRRMLSDRVIFEV